MGAFVVTMEVISIKLMDASESEMVENIGGSSHRGGMIDRVRGNLTGRAPGPSSNEADRSTRRSGPFPLVSSARMHPAAWRASTHLRATAFERALMVRMGKERDRGRGQNVGDWNT